VAYRGKSVGDNGIGSSYANKVEIVLAASSNDVTWRQPPGLDLLSSENSGR
jgi:hypothetical protein